MKYHDDEYDNNNNNNDCFGYCLIEIREKIAYFQRTNSRLSRDLLDPDEEITQILTTENPHESKNLVIFSHRVGLVNLIKTKFEK